HSGAGTRPSRAIAVAHSRIARGRSRSQARMRSAAAASADASNSSEMTGCMGQGLLRRPSLHGRARDEGDGAFVGADPAAPEELTQGELERLPVVVPVIQRLALHVRTVAAGELYLELPMWHLAFLRPDGLRRRCNSAQQRESHSNRAGVKPIVTI